jgi:hypothetical protein
MSQTLDQPDPERIVADVVSAAFPGGSGRELRVTTHAGCLVCGLTVCSSTAFARYHEGKVQEGRFSRSETGVRGGTTGCAGFCFPANTKLIAALRLLTR